MHDDSTLVELRISRFVRERLRPAVNRSTMRLTIEAWHAPGEPVPFGDAITQTFAPFETGTRWGRPWGTTWFHLTGVVPEDWVVDDEVRLELLVDLGFSAATPGFQAEGLVFRPDGVILKAISPRNRSVPLPAAPGEPIDLYLEAAANPDVTSDFTFVATDKGDLATAGDEPAYTLRQIDLALRDETVWQLLQDFWTLTGLMRELPTGTARRADILRALERCIDAVDPDDVRGTAVPGRAALADVLASPANASAHRLHAVGHAHIDSAWLWPVRETVRKVARTFSNVLALIEANPDFVFAASSAQQYAWLKEFYPELYARVKEQVAAGSFVPVGGMWVESDTNMPGGEALVRQFVAGKRFFLAEFGIEPLEVWLPDSFGYSAALPQIVALAGSRWFLTQKTSWNETNLMPHHTFRWEGIDGSRIFTHFPPVDTYNSDLSGEDLARAERQYAEKGAASTSLVPFGFGDGGGGPTEEMIAAARRTESLEGSPTVELSSPRRFFETAEAEYPDPPVWSGELYLEFHRGTYTSQARTKRGNRRSEHLLREAELWATTAAVRTGAPYPYDLLETTWHTVLLAQFHDILPGSSIAWVHQEAERNYAAVAETLTGLIEDTVRQLCGPGENSVLVNAGPYPLQGVNGLAGADAAHPDRSAASGTVTVTHTPAGIVLDNGLVAVTIDANGLFSSIWDVAAKRELVPVGTPGNLLQLHRDTPTQWDAWDIDEHYKKNTVDLVGAESVDVMLDTPARAEVRITRAFGASRVVQTVTLSAGSPAVDMNLDLDWHERQKLLKLAFPLDVNADRAASEIQFGHVFRSTHTNTSWDAARFETVAHRWVHVGEPGYGVAVGNDSTYGYDIGRSPDGAGRPATTVRMSLLRAAVFPDPAADQGPHELRVSLRAGSGIPDAVAEGYRLNLPLRTVTGVADADIEPLLRVDNPAVVVEAVKLAEDRSGDVIVRLYEAHGNRSTARLIRHFEATDVVETDLLERPLAEPRVELAAGAPLPVVSHALTLTLRPFEIVTLRFTRP
jgi:alpha-mannosidase